MREEPTSADDPPAGGKTSHRRRHRRAGWAPPDAGRDAPKQIRSGKTMHHPAFRIGEIKRGK